MADSPTLNQTLDRRRDERAAEQLMQDSVNRLSNIAVDRLKVWQSICRSHPRSPTTGRRSQCPRGLDPSDGLETRTSRLPRYPIDKLQPRVPAGAVLFIELGTVRSSKMLIAVAENNANGSTPAAFMGRRMG